MDVVDQVEVVEEEVVVVVVVVVEEVDVDQVVDHLDQENHLVPKMSVTNVVVSFFWNQTNKHSFLCLLWTLDRGHYAYDCEIRLRRQRRLKYEGERSDWMI